MGTDDFPPVPVKPLSDCCWTEGARVGSFVGDGLGLCVGRVLGALDCVQGAELVGILVLGALDSVEGAEQVGILVLGRCVPIVSAGDHDWGVGDRVGFGSFRLS